MLTKSMSAFCNSIAVLEKMHFHFAFFLWKKVPEGRMIARA